MKIKFTDSDETEQRQRDAIALLSYMFPADDEEWQEIVESAFISDKSLLSDFFEYGSDGAEEMARLRTRFPNGFVVNEQKYIWQIVDDIKRKFSLWPDSFDNA